ncbi:MAG: fumarate hydratase, partial [Myxococcales bacterium]
MAGSTTPPFAHQNLFELEHDTTEYRLLTKDFVGVSDFEGQSILKVDPAALTHVAQTALRDCNFYLRPAHLKQVAAILDDPEASENDRYVALTMLRNAEVAAQGILPFCQDTGTATVIGKKGQSVWTGTDDAGRISEGIYRAYTDENLRYSQ